MNAERQLTAEIKDTIRADYAKLKAGIPGFRTRPAQAEMMAAVAKTLSQPGGVLLVDAPTGIGKSMAYLLSAIPLAKAYGMKLVISTGSVALQQQLVDKDIPTYQRLLNPNIRPCLAKGRARYACPRNLMELAGTSNQGSFDGMESEGVWQRPPKPGEVELVHALASDLSESRWDGDLDKAPAQIPPAIRQMITTSSASCSGQRCAFAGVCPFLKARAELEAADIVIANHSLVMSDFMIENDQGTHGGVILPEPENTLYVFDEGHTLEQAAIEASAQEFCLSQAPDRIKKHERPFATAIRALGNAAPIAFDVVQADIQAFKQNILFLQQSVNALWTPERGQYDPTWTAPLGVIPSHIRDLAVELSSITASIERHARTMREAVLKAGLSDGMTDRINRDLGHVQDYHDSAHQLFYDWACRDDETETPKARWISLAGRHLYCHASPITAQSILQQTLWANAAATVVTSATLAIGASFSHIRRHLGAPESATTLKLQSPFDIKANGEFVIPWINAVPSEPDKHNAELVNWLIKDHAWQHGNLVLFTSKRKMQAVYDALPTALQAIVKMQTEGVNKAELLSRHRADIEQGRGSTLFGLESLGTGVDLPGDLCTSVVITQLPFSVPSDPVGMTRAAHCTKLGGNPFHDLVIPQAIRTMTQYSGRLLRTEEDRGRVVLLDRRIINNSYGKRIIEAMPDFRLRTQRPAFASLPD